MHRCVARGLILDGFPEALALLVISRMHLALPIGAFAAEERMQIAVDAALGKALKRHAESRVEIAHGAQKALACRLQSVLEDGAQMTLPRRAKEHPLKLLAKLCQNFAISPLRL